MANAASAQEVVVSTSGGLGEAETAAASALNVIPREGGNTFQRRVLRQRRERLDAGEQLHAEAEGPGPENAVASSSRVRRQPAWAAAGSSATSCGSTRRTASISTSNTVPGMWVNKNAGNPNAWTCDFDQTKPGLYGQPGSDRTRAASRCR